ncbi:MULTISPECIES: hypothetical protein [Nitrosomonas]|uniref:hypothetical protein n=1 Tax=Nitrosomonas TaxID=914 RepID=UPI001F4480C5|nr:MULTISPECIES: hypothetical protein [Nitrosomonas]HNS58207.1 hypothetical protein [Nitrosomonas europaea]
MISFFKRILRNSISLSDDTDTALSLKSVICFSDRVLLFLLLTLVFSETSSTAPRSSDFSAGSNVFLFCPTRTESSSDLAALTDFFLEAEVASFLTETTSVSAEKVFLAFLPVTLTPLSGVSTRDLPLFVSVTSVDVTIFFLADPDTFAFAMQSTH